MGAFVGGQSGRGAAFSERYGVLEREANIIADLPRQYGKPGENRFYKGDPSNDNQPVSKEALIGAIKKCHQTLWAGLLTRNLGLPLTVGGLINKRI